AAAERGWCVSERLERAAVEIEPFELPVREEGDRPTVWRPERRGGTIGSLEHAGGQRIQRAEPQALRAIRLRGDEHNLATVGRDRLSRDVSVETSFIRRKHCKLTRRCRHLATALPCEDAQHCHQTKKRQRRGPPRHVFA